MQEEEERDQALQAKASLAIPLVPETEDDRRLAALLKFHTLDCAWGASGPGGLGGQRWGSSATSGPWQARAEGSFGPPSLSSLPTPSLRGQAETQTDRDHQPLLVPLRPRTHHQQPQSRQCPEEAGPEPQISTGLLPDHCREPGHRAAAVPGRSQRAPTTQRRPPGLGSHGCQRGTPRMGPHPPETAHSSQRRPRPPRAGGLGSRRGNVRTGPSPHQAPLRRTRHTCAPSAPLLWLITPIQRVSERFWGPDPLQRLRFAQEARGTAALLDHQPPERSDTAPPQTSLSRSGGVNLFGPGEGVCALWDVIPTLKTCFFVPASGS